MLRQDLFEALINSKLLRADIKNQRFKENTKIFLEQDNSDMVVISRPYLPRDYFL